MVLSGNLYIFLMSSMKKVVPATANASLVGAYLEMHGILLGTMLSWIGPQLPVDFNG
jgi:hypothetical protein